LENLTVVIDDKLLTKLEKLSLLQVAEDKRETMEKELTEFLNFVENLSELDEVIADLPTTFSMRGAEATLREDTSSVDREVNSSILGNAPHSEDNFFIVPKIIG
jgi:aspartyl-tRNA(Asn)/glutamyl-tRNA(Gln) amidotransferase subunit C